MCKKYYAVHKGVKPGIYTNYKEALAQTNKVKNSKMKGFNDLALAKMFFETGKKPKQTISNKQLKKLNYNSNLIVTPYSAFVDGSYCEHGNKKLGSGIVLLNENMKETKISKTIESPILKQYGASAGELVAALIAVQEAIKNNYPRLTIYFDCYQIEYASKEEHVCKNKLMKEYKRRILEYKKNIEINFIHVYAHANHPYNEMADLLAANATI